MRTAIRSAQHSNGGCACSRSQLPSTQRGTGPSRPPPTSFPPTMTMAGYCLCCLRTDLTDRRRNLIVLSVVGLMVVLALLTIIPDAPLAKKTQLGLDLRGGVELIYQAEPTPQVPKVTPQAVSDAINTIRKRTNALGVSESEVQQQGRDQVDVGLPGVKNAARAEKQVGTTAQLQFYDWEPNIIGPTARSSARTPRTRSRRTR